MKKWAPSFQSRQWPSGTPVRHLYALPASSTDHELLALAELCRGAMAPYPINPQSDDLLHITIAMDTSVSADQIGQEDTDAFVSTLQRRLADMTTSSRRDWSGQPDS